MPHCAVDAIQWKNRRAYRLSNGKIELTTLLGGGHIADFRLHGSSLNALWESPWPTIEPETFVPQEHAMLYGDGAVGRFLCGYTGYALALGYFGMPSLEEARQGLPLHGEATTLPWTVVSALADDELATLTLEVTLPVYRLHLQRDICLLRDAFAARVKETITNFNSTPITFQWVQHAAFGELFFAPGDATLFLSAGRGVTWPLEYEGSELLPKNVEFSWPNAPSIDFGTVNLTEPFAHDKSGFVAALLAQPEQGSAFVAVHNRRHHLVAGFCFDPVRFPWITLWEENRARTYPPWNMRTRVRGVEFGSSPLPLGLAHYREAKGLFDTPTLCSIPAAANLKTQYELFLTPVPPGWVGVKVVHKTQDALILRDGNDEIQVR